ncbi:MAG: hypothetical protein FIA95_16010 [Gemmatimonadetes bacterium]|nr:hypothetical protein [Gemmatimonadota bacterium]
MHLEIRGLAPRRVERVWNRYLVERGLADPLSFEVAGRAHRAWAPCYPFLPLARVREVVELAGAARAGRAALERELGNHGYDASAYQGAYGLHRAEALARGWPAWPLLLGQMPALLLGCGRLHRILTMNLIPSTSPALALCGVNKGIGRDLLSTYGLPVAPGGMAATPAQAVERAEAVGWPVVLKRLTGGNSDGGITDVVDPVTCAQAARELLSGQYSILVEKQLTGIELRAHFVGGRVREVIRRGPVAATGDGHRTLRELVEDRQRALFALARRSPWVRRKLVYRFWSFGVRRFRDLERVVPRRGVRVPIGLSFARPAGRRRGLGDLHPADLARIEAFLARHGSPSGGLALVVTEPGARLADGGGILEINVPSGFWYVSDPEAVAAEELDRVAGADPEFAAAGGRVPVWLAPVARPGATPPSALRRRFRAVHPGGEVVALAGPDPWPAVLTRDADALLVPVCEADVAAHGLPLNLAPTVWHPTRRSADLAATHPLLAATLLHAGPGVAVRTP